MLAQIQTTLNQNIPAKMPKIRKVSTIKDKVDDFEEYQFITTIEDFFKSQI